MNKIQQKKVAVALKYNLGDRAPLVIAKGRGFVAEKIIQRGDDENIKIVKDKELANRLIHLDIGSEIPEEFYTVVAEILMFIFELDREKGEDIVK